MYHNFNLLSLVWIAFTLVGGALQITAAVVLLRRGGAGPLLMLIGAVAALVCHCGGQFIYLFHAGGFSSVFYKLATTINLFGGLGWLVFCGGVLAHALALRHDLSQQRPG